MKISKIIEILQEAQEIYGDLPVSTWDGFVTGFKVDPCRDGCVPLNEEDVNELNIEFFC